MENNKTNNNTKVRYGVHYNDRNYEYALHSGKGRFLKNIADVVNVIEYCVTQELKNNGYNPLDTMFNVEVIRFVNDKPDETYDVTRFKTAIEGIIDRIIEDNLQRKA